MANSDESRWQQRYEHLGKALGQLERACGLESYSELELAGLVQMFEFTFELAWKTLKDLLFYEGFETNTPREAISKSFEVGYIDEAATETLLDGLQKRNLLSHTYNASAAEEAEHLIKNSYAPALRKVYDFLKSKRDL